PGLPRWTEGFCTRDGCCRAPPPPGSSRWSDGFCTSRGGALFSPPHRAWPGGAAGFCPEREKGGGPPVPQPPVHPGQPGGGVEPRKPSCAQAPLHRGEPGGGGFASATPAGSRSEAAECCLVVDQRRGEQKHLYEGIALPVWPKREPNPLVAHLGRGKLASL